MKLTTKRKPLLELLGKVKLAAPKRATLTILEHVLVSATDRLVLSATDLEKAVSGGCDATDTEGGAVAVPLKQFDSFLKTMKSDEVTITSKGDTMVLESGDYQAVVKGRFADDFPAIPTVSGEDIHILGFLDIALARVAYAAKKDLDRLVLHGVYFEQSGNRLNLTAADGFRLSNTSLPLVGDMPNVIIPLETVIVLQKLSKGLAVVHARIQPEGAVFQVNDITLTTQCTQGTYPNYQKLIPEDGEPVTADAGAFLSAVKSLQVSKKVDRVILKASSGVLELSGRGDDDTQPTTTIPCTGSIRTCINIRYLIDLLNTVDGDVTLSTVGHECVVRCVSGPTTHLVMPMFAEELQGPDPEPENQ